MKHFVLTVFILTSLISCNKIEEKVAETVNSAKESAERKATNFVQENVNEQINKYVNTGSVEFDSIFPHQENLEMENIVGKMANIPDGTSFYFFKYKVTDKDLLLKVLIGQSTTDESKSEKYFQKVDGKKIIDNMTFLEKFIPNAINDQGLLDELKTNKTIEYYKVRRFPNTSTIIFNPKNNIVYQFVDVQK